MYYMWINKNLVHQVGDQTKIKMDVTNTGYKVECLVDLCQDGEQWWVMVKLVMKYK
jgi:hypothetical protein